MAFSFKKMFNINYFKKTDECDAKKCSDDNLIDAQNSNESSLNYENYGSFDNCTSKKPDIYESTTSTDKYETPCHVRTLKLDITQPKNDDFDKELDENTPKHVLLDSTSNSLFKERLRELDFDKSFDTCEDDPTCHQSTLDDVNLSISRSDSDVSILSDIENDRYVKMCWKAETSENSILTDMPCKSPESFCAVDIERSDSFFTNLEKISRALESLLKDFSVNSFLLTESRQSQTFNMADRADSWNVIIKDERSKLKLDKQLSHIKNMINKFASKNLKNTSKSKTKYARAIKTKKKNKLFDFPDYRDALLSLFSPDYINTQIDDIESKCSCVCHNLSEVDSGLESSKSSQVSSSIGNFTLDNSTLSAFSESLELYSCHSSLQESSFRSFLQHKSAIDRITFYIQAHSVQITSQANDQDYESKTIITFYCPACDSSEVEESSLLKHILSQKHCERIHFLYKTAYINKCLKEGKEIQPSTILNPMLMYRDDNKIVCFGDFVYACTLCYKSNIVGESILMKHCYEPDHVSRKNRLSEMID